jgi:short-subunit dehydrogenase
MKLQGARALLTGANGGIGTAVAEGLAAKGVSLGLCGRDGERIQRLAMDLKHRHPGLQVEGFEIDLLDATARETTVEEAVSCLQGIDLLINCAGTTSFGPFEDEDPSTLERVLQLNLTVPTLLIRQFLPAMVAAGNGRIVNVGSTFGSIGFAWFAAYSASKFGLRGLSEALRRELEGTGVGVTYVAPRAVKTSLNTEAVYRMAAATKMQMDDPHWVGAQIVQAIEQDANDVYLGFPEKLFARLNGVVPRLLDGGLRKQNRLMAPFARGA